MQEKFTMSNHQSEEYDLMMVRVEIDFKKRGVTDKVFE